MKNFVLKAVPLALKYYGAGIGAAYLVLFIFDIFSQKLLLQEGPTLKHLALFGFLILFLAWRLALAALSTESIDKYFRVELSFILLLSVSIVLQATGGLESPIFPLFYLVVGLLVVYVGFISNLLLLLLIVGAFALNSWHLGQIRQMTIPLCTVLGLGLVFTMIIGLFGKMAKDRILRTQRTLHRLTEGAEQFEHRRVEGLAAINREHIVKADINALLQIERVLGDLVDITKRALTAHTCLIALTENEGTALLVRAVSSNEKPPDGFFGADLAATVIMQAVSEGRNLRAENLDRLSRAQRYRAWGAVPKSLIVVPLMENNRIIGVLTADHEQPNHFGQEEERFMEMMARRVVEAVGREREYRDLTSERSEFAAFYSLMKQLGSSIDLNEVSRVVLESARELLPYDYGVLIRVEPEVGTGVIEAVMGLPEEKFVGAQFSLTESLVGWVVGSKLYLHYPRLRERLGTLERIRPILSEKLPLKEVESLLCVPLIRQNFVTGLLLFAAKLPEAFSVYEIKIVEVLAIQAAVSLDNARIHAEMEQMATRDGLTGCYNHRYFQEWLDQEITRARRMPIKIALILCDIDHFKRVNDNYGHPVGDLVLKTIANILRSSVRQNDLAARYGGEEFALVLLNSEQKGAKQFAERVRQKAAKAETKFAGGRLQVTISMGIAVFPDDADNKQGLIELADQALYAAKQAGRNCVQQAHHVSLHQD